MIPAARTSARELAVALLLPAVWLGAWSLLTVAAWVGGGRPAASPLSFADPARIARRLSAGTAALPWRLVDTSAPVVAWRFWLAFSTAIAVAVVAGAWAVRRAPRGGGSAALRPSSASGWARRRDLRGLLSVARRGGFALGRHGLHVMSTQPETSVLVIGPTRSGKTSALVIPNLLRWSGPAVVTSTKAEVLDATAAHRQSIGPVHVYDPAGEVRDRYPMLTWSPLSGCTDLDHAWRVATWLCAGLQQGGSRGDNDWAHWAESGKLLIAPLLFAAACSRQSIVDVRAWIHGFDLQAPAAILDDMAWSTDDPAAEDARRALAMLTSVDQRPEKERGTVFSTVMRIFNVFNERDVARSAEWNRFTAQDFMRRRGTLYLCTPGQSPERMAALFVGILMTVVTAAYKLADASPGGRLDRPLGLFLDELANVVPVDDLPSIASQGAGRGVVLMSVVQDLSQLRARYGVDRSHSILNNHVCKVVLPGLGDPETAEVMGRLAGQRSVTDVGVSHSGATTTRSYTRRLEPVASPDMLRRLRDGTAVVLYRSRPPALVRLQPWYRQRALRRLCDRGFVPGAEHVASGKRVPG